MIETVLNVLDRFVPTVPATQLRFRSAARSHRKSRQSRKRTRQFQAGAPKFNRSMAGPRMSVRLPAVPSGGVLEPRFPFPSHASPPDAIGGTVDARTLNLENHFG